MPLASTGPPPRRSKTSASSARKEVFYVIKARLFHLSVVACLVLFVLVSAAQLMPDSMFDGAD